MAFKVDISTTIPIMGEIPVSAYCKVLGVRGSASSMVATLEMRNMDSSGERVGQVTFQFVPDLDGPNFIAQAYSHIKSMPQFSGSIDC